MQPMADHSRLVLKRALSSSQTEQLVELFQQEWWTKGRTKVDTEIALRNGGPIFAFINPDADELVAFARTTTDGVYKAMIFDIIVKKSWRGTGLGALLMETIMSDEVIKAVKHRELYCLEEMGEFYGRWGFTNNLPGLIFMRKSS